jgi:hypothetical protein
MIHYKKILLALSLLLPQSGNAIFGGHTVDQNILNSVVNIKFRNGMCSGSVIAPRVVLTAAHCRDRSGEPEFVVIYNSEGPAHECDISNVIEHAYHTEAEQILPMNVHAPDILLLKLESPLCSANIAELSKEPFETDDVLFHTGYGAGSGILYQTNEISLTVIETNGAELFTTNEDSISRRLLEIGRDFYSFALPAEQNTTACHGDSGGPLYLKENGQMSIKAVNGAVLGHSDYGADSCNRGYLHMISPIHPYLDWIESKIFDWSN